MNIQHATPKTVRKNDFAHLIQSNYKENTQIIFNSVVNRIWPNALLNSSATVCLWRIKLKNKPIH